MLISWAPWYIFNRARRGLSPEDCVPVPTSNWFFPFVQYHCSVTMSPVKFVSLFPSSRLRIVHDTFLFFFLFPSFLFFLYSFLFSSFLFFSFLFLLFSLFSQVQVKWHFWAKEKWNIRFLSIYSTSVFNNSCSILSSFWFPLNCYSCYSCRKRDHH